MENKMKNDRRSSKSESQHDTPPRYEISYYSDDILQQSTSSTSSVIAHQPNPVNTPPNIQTGKDGTTDSEDQQTSILPDFSLYRASFKADSIGNIITHDPHLNSDGEALCRFILLQLSTPPELFIKITGTHEDLRIESFTQIVDGRSITQTRERRDTITDFSFTIPLSSNQISESGIKKIYVASDTEVVGRGSHRRQISNWESGRDLKLFWDRSSPPPDFEDLESSEIQSKNTNVGFKRRRRADKIAREIRSHGHPPFIPPWLFPNGTFSVEPDRPPPELVGSNYEQRKHEIFKSTVHQEGYMIHDRVRNLEEERMVLRELRDWCDDYCSNQRKLKEFKVEKIIFGWDLVRLENELLEFLHSIPHLPSTHFRVEFHSTSSKIIIRPLNPISKIFSLNGFYKFILTITLIYPILLLIRYLFLGVQYDIIKSAYPLVYWKDPLTRVGLTEMDWLDNHRQSITELCRSGRIGAISESY